MSINWFIGFALTHSQSTVFILKRENIPRERVVIIELVNLFPCTNYRDIRKNTEHKGSKNIVHKGKLTALCKLTANRMHFPRCDWMLKNIFGMAVNGTTVWRGHILYVDHNVQYQIDVIPFHLEIIHVRGNLYCTHDNSLRSWRDFARECLCFGREAVNTIGEAVRALVRLRRS